MPSLICDVKNCSYNQDNYCCLSAIEVGDENATNMIETCCYSFNEGAYIDSNCAKEKQAHVSIKCSARNCIYNMSQVCTAECVPITETSSTCCDVEDTLCGAFICE